MAGDISIGRLTARIGLAVSAIRYYETQGLVTPMRSEGGQRRFARSDIRRLSFVLIAQKLGFPIARIAGLMADLPKGRAPSEADWARIAAVFRDDLTARIETLERLRDNLDGCIGCGCLTLRKCALYNPEGAAETCGAGPRYLMGDRAADVLAD